MRLRRGASVSWGLGIFGGGCKVVVGGAGGMWACVGGRVRGMCARGYSVAGWGCPGWSGWGGDGVDG